MRRVKEIRDELLSRGGRYKEVYSEAISSKDRAPLKVKGLCVGGHRYVLCLNEKQARKDVLDRQLIVEALGEKLRNNPKALIGNKGYRKYLKLDRGHLGLDEKKVEKEERFDGKWVLQTNTALTPERVVLKYKELWQVEQVFQDVKSILRSRPVFHKCDETIRGHVFCSLLALVLKKELDRRLEQMGHCFE